MCCENCILIDGVKQEKKHGVYKAEMERTKGYTSKGPVIWGSKGVDKRSSMLRQPEVLFEFHDLAQTQDLDDTETSNQEYIGDAVEEVVLDLPEQNGDDVELSSPLHLGATKGSVTDLRHNLAQWSSSNRIPDNAMDDLLGLLKKHRVPGLPDNSLSLKLYLKSKNDRMGDSDSDQSDGPTFPGFSELQVTQKRTTEPEKNFARIDVTHLNELFDKMDIIDKKLDVLTANGIAHSDMLRHVLNEIASLKASSDLHQSLCKGISAEGGDDVHSTLLPVKDQTELENLERYSKQTEGRAILRKCFNETTATDAYAFLRSNVDRVFQNAGRYSWSGRPAVNASYDDTVRCASKLNIVLILIDLTTQRYKISREDCITQAMKVFARFNQKHLMRRKRARDGILRANF